MEGEKQLSERILDAFLIPAVASTFVVLLYLAFKGDGPKLKKKPVAVSKEIYITQPESKRIDNPLNTKGYLHSPSESFNFIIKPPAVVIQVHEDSSRNSFQKMMDQKTYQSSVEVYDGYDIGLKDGNKGDCSDVTSNKDNKCLNVKSPPTDTSIKSYDIVEEGEPAWDYYDMFYSKSAEKDKTCRYKKSTSSGDCVEVLPNNVRVKKNNDAVHVDILPDYVNNLEQKRYKNYLKFVFDE